MLYLANTIGAVCGSLVVGFLLLPMLGPAGGHDHPDGAGDAGDRSAVSRVENDHFERLQARLPSRERRSGFGRSFQRITSRCARSGAPNNERRLLVSDGLTELIAVTEAPGKGRTLYTNGHAMSSTLPLSQRYMRALAHIPLLSMDNPETVLVIGFGVGNTTHAATLHPSVRRVELADLSRDILAHAEHFAAATRTCCRSEGRGPHQRRPPAPADAAGGLL